MPASANAIAAVSPAGPPPTIATSTVNGFAMIFSNTPVLNASPNVLCRARRGAGNHDPGRHFRMLPAMRYRFAVTDFANEHPLTHLSATETRLSGALSQPRRIALGCIAALTALGWLALGLMSAGSPLNWQALCQPRRGGRRGAIWRWPRRCGWR